MDRGSLSGIARIFVALLVAFIAGCDVGLSEKYIVPAGYVGDVYILPGYRHGQPPEREGMARVFRIPATGILVTQDWPSDGWHSMRYYEVDVNGKRTELTYEGSTIPVTAATLRDERRIAWFARGIGGMTSPELPCDVRFTQFYVGTPAHLLKRTPEEANAKEREVEQLVKRQRLCP